MSEPYNFLEDDPDVPTLREFFRWHRLECPECEGAELDDATWDRMYRKVARWIYVEDLRRHPAWRKNEGTTT
jgi:hypothetical protein